MTNELQPVNCEGQMDLLSAPVARSTDPQTSWDAARSITPERRSRGQSIVLHAVSLWGPMTDEALVYAIGREFGDVLSPSGIRTRRRELVDEGLIMDTGDRERLQSGRSAIIWGLA